MPQGQFLECMGIAHRVEALQNQAKGYTKKKELYDSYARLCSPDEMGAIYKILFMGEKSVGEIYPFLSQETIDKQKEYFE